jgi:hypothetical protein
MLGSDIGAHGSNKYREKEGIKKRFMQVFN